MMSLIPLYTVVKVAKTLLEIGFTTCHKELAFPVFVPSDYDKILLGSLLEPLGEQLGPEFHVMYTIDGKEWYLKATNTAVFLGIYPFFYQPLN